MPARRAIPSPYYYYERVFKMTMYEKIKSAVSVPEAAKSYGLTVGKNGMARCPFHEDHTPSLKLNEDYYYCFGCEAFGDVIDFTANLFGISNWSAAKKLAMDFGLGAISSDTERSWPDEAAAEEAISDLAVYRNLLVLCIRTLAGYEEVLVDWKEHYAPASPEEPIDDRFVEACQALPYICDVLDYLTVAPFEMQSTLVSRLMENDYIPELREYVGEELRKIHERDAV